MEQRPATIDELRIAGHAVVIFNARELQCVKPRVLEDYLVQQGIEFIDTYGVNSGD